MNSTYEIIIFYKYATVSDPVGFVNWLKATCTELNIRGRILIAKEGINGSVEGTSDMIAEFKRRLLAQDGSAGTYGDFSDLWFKTSPGTGGAFAKLKVKARNVILATGLKDENDIDPNRTTGTHIEADELKSWIENGEDFEIIDMRNDYEYDVGHFAGSHASHMKNFRDLVSVTPLITIPKDKKILTVCTYGVRCEKASGYLKQQGFENVFQLNGGIGTYMKKYPGQDFLGSLYVFDRRMTEQFTNVYEVIGSCVACSKKSERFGNCAWDICHKQMIICEECAPNASSIYCSLYCRFCNIPNRFFAKIGFKTAKV